MTTNDPAQSQPPTPQPQSPESQPVPPVSSSTRPAWLSWVIASAVTLVTVVGVMLVLDRFGGSDATASNEATAQSRGSGQAQGQGPGGQGGGPGAGFGGFGTFGEVTGIDGDTLTVATQGRDGASGTATVVTSSETTVSETVDGTLADIIVGDTVVVIGEQTDDGITAQSINVGGGAMSGGFPGGGFPGGGGGGPGGGIPTDLPTDIPTDMPTGMPTNGMRPQGGPGGGFTAGEVVAVTDASLTLQTEDGETVEVTAASDVTVRVTEDRAVSDIEVGDTISAMGETVDDQIQATSITIGELGFGGGMGGFGRRPGADR